MRIAIDASAAARETRTGIGRYISELVRALAALESGCRFDLLYRPSRWKRRRFFLAEPGPGFRTRWLLERFHFGYPGGISVFHGPDARLPAFRHVPLVASVHDTFSAETTLYASPGFRARKRRRYADVARRAHVVITFSEYVRQRFVAHTRVDPARVRVIPHGVDGRFGAVRAERVAAQRARYGLAGPYLLYVGQLSRRKNLVRLLEAFAGLAAEAVLVLAGPPSHGVDEVRAAHDRLGLAGRVRFLGPVAEEDLPALYAGATLHLLPSLDEGFGLPVLEAFAAGTPVVASTAGALPEVAGDAAVLADPTDAAAIGRAMRTVLEDGHLRATLRERGRARVRAFTWQRAAAATLAVYREVAGA